MGKEAKRSRKDQLIYFSIYKDFLQVLTAVHSIWISAKEDKTNKQIFVRSKHKFTFGNRKYFLKKRIAGIKAQLMKL